MKWVNVNLGHSWNSHMERSAKICGNHFEEISILTARKELNTKWA